MGSSVKKSQTKSPQLQSIGQLPLFSPAKGLQNPSPQLGGGQIPPQSGGQLPQSSNSFGLQTPSPQKQSPAQGGKKKVSPVLFNLYCEFHKDPKCCQTVSLNSTGAPNKAMARQNLGRGRPTSMGSIRSAGGPTGCWTSTVRK